MNGLSVTRTGKDVAACRLPDRGWRGQLRTADWVRSADLRTRSPVPARLLSFLTMMAVAGPLHLALPTAAAAAGSVGSVAEGTKRAGDTEGGVDARLPDGSTALQWAVYRRDVAEVQRLIEAGADV